MSKFKLSTIFVLLLLYLFSPLVVIADNESIGIDDTQKQDAIELELIEGLQNPKNQEFEYTLKIKSLIETSRVRVNWEIVNGLIAKAEGITLSDAVDLKEGEVLYVTKSFIPARAGNEEIRVNTLAFGPNPLYDYYSFTDTEFFINESLEISPDRSENSTARVTKAILDMIKAVEIVLIIFLVVTTVYWRFKVWYEAD